jgi:hypothetical protein
MGSIVSSVLDYSNKYPDANLSFGQLAHELEHLKVRERVSSFVALSGTVLLMLGLAGVLGGGMFLLGAFAAIALFGATYAYFTREAESSLREKQISWMGTDTKPSAPPRELLTDEGQGFLGINWFSK